MTTSVLDSRRFRNALSHFATGVTVITTQDAGGNPVGLTASSFNSVSLDPPMVLWSIARTSRSLGAFIAGDYFAVNILADDQIELSNRFAQQGTDKFQGLDWETGVGGVPVLFECAARFQCRKCHQYEGGDHLIIVGEVQAFDETGKPALVFHRGRYAVAEPHPVGVEPTDIPPGGFQDDYLMYLLARAYHLLIEPLRAELSQVGLDEFQGRVLAMLSDHDGRELSELMDVAMVDHPSLGAVLRHLEDRALVVKRTEGSRELVCLTESGRNEVVHLLATAKAHESDALEQCSDEDVQALKRALRRLIHRLQGPPVNAP